MLEFGNPFTQNRLFFPPLICSKFIIPTVSIRTLSSAPYTFMSAAPESVIVPEQVVFIKQVGTAYNLNGATNFSIRYANGILLSNNSNPDGTFNTNGLGILFLSYVFSGSPFTISSADGLINSGLQLITNADMTGGDGDIWIYLQFRIWPFGTNLS